MYIYVAGDSGCKQGGCLGRPMGLMINGQHWLTATTAVESAVLPTNMELCHGLIPGPLKMVPVGIASVSGVLARQDTPTSYQLIHGINKIHIADVNG